MVTINSTGKELLSRLSTNLSIQSFNPANSSISESIQSSKLNIPFTDSKAIQNLPPDISVFSVAQDSTKTAYVLEPTDQNVPIKNTITKPEDELWTKFEQFRQWHGSLASSLPNPTNKNADNVNITKASNFSSPSVPVVRPVSTKRIETSLPAAQTNKSSSNLSGN